MGGGDRAFDQGEVVMSLHFASRCLREIGNLQKACDRQQLVFAVEKAELAAIAGCKLPDSEPRLALRRGHLRSPLRPAGSARGRGGIQVRRGTQRPFQIGNGRKTRWRISYCAPWKDRSTRR